MKQFEYTDKISSILILTHWISLFIVMVQQFSPTPCRFSPHSRQRKWPGAIQNLNSNSDVATDESTGLGLVMLDYSTVSHKWVPRRSLWTSLALFPWSSQDLWLSTLGLQQQLGLYRHSCNKEEAHLIPISLPCVRFIRIVLVFDLKNDQKDCVTTEGPVTSEEVSKPSEI